MLSLAGRLILLAEDDALLAPLLAEMLAEAGAEVLGPAPSPAEALALLARARPDAALIDLHLAGGMTAAPIADALAARGIPFVLTGGAPGQTPLPAHPTAPLLPKPFALEEAISLLAALIGRG
ncbi:MAG: response regulator [Rhodovarius sp.]|nr:response regulator [Rhodovarius sp.]MCX7932685.1 response regulator [Rhodovarius sp.]MDW8315944.1 response regulator [Rhodovarius sp.]